MARLSKYRSTFLFLSAYEDCFEFQTKIFPDFGECQNKWLRGVS